LTSLGGAATKRRMDAPGVSDTRAAGHWLWRAIAR